MLCRTGTNLARVIWLLISLLVVVDNCLGFREQRDIQLSAGGEDKLETPGYPDKSPDPGTSILWSITSPPGTVITVDCDDVRISETEGCKKGYLIVSYSGGKSSLHCGAVNELRITSSDNHMTVLFELIWAAGMASCKVKASGEPSVDPNLQDSISGNIKKIFVRPSLPTPAMDLRPVPVDEKRIWEFVSEPGYKVGIECPNLWFSKVSAIRQCEIGNLTIDLGSEKKVFCEREGGDKIVTFVSESNKLIVTLETTRAAVGFVVCRVMATKGPHYQPWRNEVWLDEDSSEYGDIQKAGLKSTTCNCGWANKPKGRILNGVDAAPNEYPWMASLWLPGDLHFCGGSIVTEYHVITAAHCTERFPTKDVRVVVGVNHLRTVEGRQILQAKKIINHGYVKGYATNKDISIIMVDEKIIFNQKVGPVCLPAYEPINLYGSYLTIMGWGLMTPEEAEWRQKDILKKAKMRAISMSVCNMAHNNRYDTKPETQICAWSEKSDVCYGDSGGPVVWLDPETNRYTLVGIPTACDGCKLESPSVHTALHYYYPWVLDIIKSTSHPEARVCTKID
uniref:Venom S1 protease with CUB domain 10 n=1 Tax=Ectomocoris sp. TaxID=3104572 RepID=A0AB38ZEE1_9HEMI